MPLQIDMELNEEEIRLMRINPESSWYTQVEYKNIISPKHPSPKAEYRFEIRKNIMNDWIEKSVRGKRVLDVFSANGAFSCIAAMSGAKEVVGVEYVDERVKCAEFISSTINTNCHMKFIKGDVYNLQEYFKEPFDVSFCFGGLHHMADPAYILRQIGKLTKEKLILDTSHILFSPFNKAKFIYEDKDIIKTIFKWLLRKQNKMKWHGANFEMRGGKWYYSKSCIRELLYHGGFDIIEDRQLPFYKRFRESLYFAFCKKVD